MPLWKRQVKTAENSDQEKHQPRALKTAHSESTGPQGNTAHSESTGPQGNTAHSESTDLQGNTARSESTGPQGNTARSESTGQQGNTAHSESTDLQGNTARTRAGRSVKKDPDSRDGRRAEESLTADAMKPISARNQKKE